MANWILKEEPTHYSWSELVRDGSTQWDGVHNALALRYLRRMVPGDRALYYHTGDERACVGLMRIASGAQPDRNDPRPSWWVKVAPVRPLRRPIPLSEIKADPALAKLDLIRIGRLSVVPVSDEQWARLLSHEDAQPSSPFPAKGNPRRPSRSAASRRRPSAARRTR